VCARAGFSSSSSYACETKDERKWNLRALSILFSLSN